MMLHSKYCSAFLLTFEMILKTYLIPPLVPLLAPPHEDKLHFEIVNFLLYKDYF